ncbi:helix-turn-helix domain-containing protein [Nocardiopsis sp. HUAS JQ3]|uniref:helix-turn-helix domain-containing protein n=1 Tax=Nocardiopsis sp. HUAS JQ3 TaxID=3061629 RepID=UPI0023A9C3E0|nr:helix-turn-helix transcriptional regulator [Nocardiopsis sp. HUAS JQ3]WDZ91198.1 helix-turn-helix transcriptional regulator [Nocardiopsis sp. HUAS JQ3]
MAENKPPAEVGKRVARARKRRGLTQLGLAQRTSYSRSHIAQVEAGHKVATASFIAAVAEAVQVDQTELYGQPFRGETPRGDRVHAPIPDIRRVMTFVDVPPDLEGPPRDLDRLAQELRRADGHRHRSRHSQLGALLPALLEELTWHAYETETPRAWALLNRAHTTAASLTRRLGYTDLTSVIMERAAVSARMSQDPNLPPLMSHRRALVMMSVSAWGPALKLLRRSASQVDHDRPDAVEVYGSLHLRAAVVAARAGDAATAQDHYAQAVETSERAGSPSLDRHGTDFDPGNLAIHRAALAVELRDYDEALKADRAIKPRLLASVAPERRAHHLIDMTRVHVEQNELDRALRRLLAAERAAPQMVRYHPAARSVATHMQDRHRVLSEDLRGLLARMRLA